MSPSAAGISLVLAMGIVAALPSGAARVEAHSRVNVEAKRASHGVRGGNVKRNRHVEWSDLSPILFGSGPNQYAYDPFKVLRPGEWQVLRPGLTGEGVNSLFGRSEDGADAVRIYFDDCGLAYPSCQVFIDFQVSTGKHPSGLNHPLKYNLDHSYIMIDDSAPMRMGGRLSQGGDIYMQDVDIRWPEGAAGFEVLEYLRSYKFGARRELRREMFCGHKMLTIGAEGYAPRQFSLNGYALRPLIVALNKYHPEHYTCGPS